MCLGNLPWHCLAAFNDEVRVVSQRDCSCRLMGPFAAQLVPNVANLGERGYRRSTDKPLRTFRLAFHTRRSQGRMLRANRLNDLLKDFSHYVANTALERLVFRR
jgi:hypothetical protein